MKKKIILSLILAMCCIMASIPASAADDTCDECGPFVYLCYSTGEYTTSTHYVYSADDYCTFECRVYVAEKTCEECVTVASTRTHGHGKYNHTLCGASNSEGCSLGYN